MFVYTYSNVHVNRDIYTYIYIYIHTSFILQAPLNLHPFVLEGLDRTKTFFTLLLGVAYSGKTGVTADCDKIEFRLFNSSSIFNITLREELFSLPKQNHPCCLVLVSWR